MRSPDLLRATEPRSGSAANESGERMQRTRRAEVKEPFPRGSLLKFFTPVKAKEEMALFKGCSLELPE